MIQHASLIQFRSWKTSRRFGQRCVNVSTISLDYWPL